MASPTSCNPCCSVAQNVAIPGAAGADASPIAPGTVDPNGNVIALFPGQTYFRTDTSTFWVATAAGNASWHELIGGAA